MRSCSATTRARRWPGSSSIPSAPIPTTTSRSCGCSTSSGSISRSRTASTRRSGPAPRRSSTPTSSAPACTDRSIALKTGTALRGRPFFLFQEGRERSEARLDGARELECQDPPSLPGQGQRVPPRLGLEQAAEILRWPGDPRDLGDRQLRQIRRHEHQEVSPVPVALVELARRVEIARPEPDRDREAGLDAKSGRQPRKHFFDRGAPRKKSQERDVVALAAAGEKSCQDVFRAFGALRRGDPDASREGPAVVLRSGPRRAAGGGQDLAGALLGRFDVGLIEGVDLQDMGGDGRGELPEKEMPTQVIRVVERETDER